MNAAASNAADADWTSGEDRLGSTEVLHSAPLLVDTAGRTFAGLSISTVILGGLLLLMVL